jgi:hypothetical protein
MMKYWARRIGGAGSMVPMLWSCRRGAHGQAEQDKAELRSVMAIRIRCSQWTEQGKACHGALEAARPERSRRCQLAGQAM